MSETISYGPPIISIDVEDWPQSSWDRNLPITDRAVENTRRVIRILRKANVRATMFVLGKLAERFPCVVKEIRADGHEVACHGYGHVEIAHQSPDEFLAGICRAKDLLEQITGEKSKDIVRPIIPLFGRRFGLLTHLRKPGLSMTPAWFRFISRDMAFRSGQSCRRRSGLPMAERLWKPLSRLSAGSGGTGL